MNLYVSNLSFSVSDEDLSGFFSPYGAVSSARVVSDKFTGRSRGFGFVEMPDAAAAQRAIAALDNGTVDGSAIRVTEARPKDATPAESNSPFDDDYGYRRSKW